MQLDDVARDGQAETESAPSASARRPDETPRRHAARRSILIRGIFHLNHDVGAVVPDGQRDAAALAGELHRVVQEIPGSALRRQRRIGMGAGVPSPRRSARHLCARASGRTSSTTAAATPSKSTGRQFEPHLRRQRWRGRALVDQRPLLKWPPSSARRAYAPVGRRPARPASAAIQPTAAFSGVRSLRQPGQELVLERPGALGPAAARSSSSARRLFARAPRMHTSRPLPRGSPAR